jgi:hypothetical protein
VERYVLATGFTQVFHSACVVTLQQIQPQPGSEVTQWLARQDEQARALQAHFRALSPLDQDEPFPARVARLLKRSCAMISGRELRLLTDWLTIEIERRDHLAQVCQRQLDWIEKLAQYDYR